MVNSVNLFTFVLTKKQIVMATIQNSTDLRYWLKRLESAIKEKKKKAILEVYSVFEEYDFNWDEYPSYFKKFEKLVDTGNNVLYS